MNWTHVMDEFCEKAELTMRLKDNIRRALEYSANKSILSSSEKEEFFDSIPTRLKTSLAEGMFKGAITVVPFFRNKDSVFLANLLPMLKPLKLSKGEYVYRKEQFPNHVYFMIDGRVNLLIGTHEMAFKCFLAGSYFGEIEIFQQTLRQYSVRCQINCEFLTLDREYFGELMDKFPSIESEMFSLVQDREAAINEAARCIKSIAGIAESDGFWKGKEPLNYAEIIATSKLTAYI